MKLFGTKTNYKGEMRECLKELMLHYIKEFPSVADEVVPIFSDAEMLIRKESERSLARSMKRNQVNSECGALNILQNFAMIEIKPASTRDIIIGSEDNAAYNLYNYVNDLKLKRGYISKEQYEENARLSIKLSLRW